MESSPAIPDQPIVNFVGEKVALGPRRRELVPLYTKWINDFEAVRGLGVGMRPTTREAEEEWYERTSKGDRDAGFTIYERATMRPIGNAGLHGVDHRHRVAEFGILIGEKDCWGKGYGTEATALVLEYGFTALGLHSIMLRAYSFNERAIRAYTRAGFRLVGRWREAHRLGGQAYDVVFMDCLATEFQGQALRHLLPEG
jgi:RimJ/RimL family protein N-acetyltransferase